MINRGTGMAESHEALERFESAHEHGHAGGIARIAALTVAIVAAFLAVSTFLGNESVKEAIQGQVTVAQRNGDAGSFDTQSTVYDFVQLLVGESAKSSDASVAQAAQDDMKNLDSINAKVIEQQKRLKEKLQESRDEVTHANRQHLRYEFAEVLLQIAIVLASVAIIADKRYLLYGGHGVAVAGIVFLALGYTV
jgi:flavin-binding protein dodecin